MRRVPDDGIRSWFSEQLFELHGEPRVRVCNESCFDFFFLNEARDVDALDVARESAGATDSPVLVERIVSSATALSYVDQLVLVYAYVDPICRSVTRSRRYGRKRRDTIRFSTISRGIRLDVVH